MCLSISAVIGVPTIRLRPLFFETLADALLQLAEVFDCVFGREGYRGGR